ncbi:MAG: hypothetical protein PVH41_19545 [Anaerolineae bacterium]|jgi:hypothetical protein
MAAPGSHTDVQLYADLGKGPVEAWQAARVVCHTNLEALVTPNSLAVVACRDEVGTAAVGLRAGVPSIVIPFFGDRFCLGQRVVTPGAGNSVAVVEAAGERKRWAAAC